MREDREKAVRDAVSNNNNNNNNNNNSNNNNNNNNNIYLLGTNSTVQFSNASCNKINYILDYLQVVTKGPFSINPLFKNSVFR